MPRLCQTYANHVLMFIPTFLFHNNNINFHCTYVHYRLCICWFEAQEIRNYKTQLMLNMNSIADFTNAAVAAATNPSNARYYHGEHTQAIDWAYADNMQAPFPTTTKAGPQLVKLQLLLLILVVSRAYTRVRLIVGFPASLAVGESKCVAKASASRQL